MTPQQAAMVDGMERRIAERFEQLAIPQPQESARRLIEDLIRAGWRPWPSLVDGPPPRRAARPAVAQAALAEARQVLAAKRGHRPEDGAR